MTGITIGITTGGAGRGRYEWLRPRKPPHSPVGDSPGQDGQQTSKRKISR